METQTRVMVTLGVLMLLVFGLYFFTDWFSKTTGYVLGEDEKVKLAQCLAGKEITFYQSTTCPSCEDQINLFGETASKFLIVKTCTSTNDCPEGGVPAWVINGKPAYGVQQLSELITLSGCSVKTGS